MRLVHATGLLPLTAVVIAACTGVVGDPVSHGGAGTPGSGNAGGGSPPGSMTGVMTDACMGQPIAPMAPRVWRLTTPQVKNTLLGVFGFAGTTIDTYPADSRPDTSEYADVADSMVVGDLLTTFYAQTAQEVADNVITRADKFLGCAVTDLGAGTCLQSFLGTYGQQAWRRPLTTQEITGLQGLYTSVASTDGAQTGFNMVIQALILSPNFVFRTELGTSQTPGTTTTLTDYEIASALSYMLWDSPPDQALYDAAAAGMLHQPDVLTAQVRRMFAASTSAGASLGSFVSQWLHTDGLPAVTKSAADFPMWNAAVAKDLAAETVSFVSSVAFDPTSDRTLGSLLTASYGFVSSATAPIYGVSAPAPGSGLVRTNFDPSQRSGVLTRAGFLAAVSNYDDTDLPARGNFVRGALLCDPSPPPPAVFMFDPSMITPDMTQREKFIVHTKSATCAACHNLFDGIGFALENYDPIGRFQTTEVNKPIDPSGTAPLPNGGTLTFSNFIDMLKQVTASPDLASCYASQYVRYTTGRTSSEVSACEIQTVAKAFDAAGNTIDALPVAVATLPSFITRQN